MMLRISLIGLSIPSLAEQGPCSDTSAAFCESMVAPGSYCDVASGVCSGSDVACDCSATEDVSSSSAVAERRLAITNTTLPPSKTTTTTTKAPSTTTTATTTKATTTTTTTTKAPTTTSTTTTTKAPTTTSATTTTKAPITTISNPLAGCASPAQSSQPIFIWMEWPSLPQTTAAWNSYYSGLASFIQSNCAMLSVTRLIIRFILPVFPLNVSQGPWWPPAASSLYTQLLKPLASRNIELYAYPYVMDAYNQQQWAAFSPDKTNVIRGVFEFTKQWNTFLTSVGSVSKFKGVVFDYEEFNRNNPTVLSQVQGMGPLKTEYGFQTGIALGYNSFSHMTMWDSVMDQFYLEFYDFYYVAGVNATPQSPFLLYKNQPQTLASFILKTVLGGLSENTAKYGPKVQVMWSNQNINMNCQYPLNNKTCGPNYEFGVWSASAFNQFLAAFRQLSPNLGSKPQGIFQYSFTPTDWYVTAPPANGR